MLVPPPARECVRCSLSLRASRPRAVTHAILASLPRAPSTAFRRHLAARDLSDADSDGQMGPDDWLRTLLKHTHKTTGVWWLGWLHRRRGAFHDTEGKLAQSLGAVGDPGLKDLTREQLDEYKALFEKLDSDGARIVAGGHDARSQIATQRRLPSSDPPPPPPGVTRRMERSGASGRRRRGASAPPASRVSTRGACEVATRRQPPSAVVPTDRTTDRPPPPTIPRSHDLIVYRRIVGESSS